MISIEVCWIKGLDDQNLNIAKCLLKLRQAAAFEGSDVWIRINPNYVRPLECSHLIIKNPENRSFVQLTQEGHTVVVFSDTLEMSLEEYFVHEDNIEGLIEDVFKISLTKTSFKVVHDVCHCCNQVKRHLTHIVDNDKNDGMYCRQCLSAFGYPECQKRTNQRKMEARYAFSIRQNKTSSSE